MKPSVAELAVGARAAAWADAGFTVEDDECRAGSVTIRLGGGEGLTGWSLRGASSADLDGLPTELVDPARPKAADSESPAAHPNGTVRIDHLVAFTPDLERTTAALEATGIERRRVREVEMDAGKLRQGFFRLGEVILEIVEHANVGPGPARFWGITFAVADLDASAEVLGERLGAIRDAVQPGRRIATVRREAELGLPVALITD